jgi:hypothetical protein
MNMTDQAQTPPDDANDDEVTRERQSKPSPETGEESPLDDHSGDWVASGLRPYADASAQEPIDLSQGWVLDPRTPGSHFTDHGTALLTSDLLASLGEGIGTREGLIIGSTPAHGKYRQGKSVAATEILAQIAARGPDAGLLLVKDEFRDAATPADGIRLEGFRLAMHLTGAHADATALDGSPEDNEASHAGEHEGGGHGHPLDDLSYDPDQVREVIRQAAENKRAFLDEETHLALHLSSGHGDDHAFFRTWEQNVAAHNGVPLLLHRHTDVQNRYEMALAHKIEADDGEGTMIAWSPVPHAPHEVADLARMMGDIYAHEPHLPPDLIAVDLAWIKTSTWPWGRRLKAAVLLLFPFFADPPSRRLGRKSHRK